MKKNKDLIIVYLCIFSETATVDKLIKFIGKKPSEVQKKNELINNTKMRSKENSISYYVNGTDTLDLDTYITELKKKFSFLTKLKRPKDFQYSINCVVSLKSRDVSLFLSPESSSFIGNIGANLNIDYYL